MVEAICPVDERTRNDAGEYVYGIPDYVLVWLLAELADKKGTNIVCPAPSPTRLFADALVSPADCDS
jgi:hypothetical protein